MSPEYCILSPPLAVIPARCEIMGARQHSSASINDPAVEIMQSGPPIIELLHFLKSEMSRTRIRLLRRSEIMRSNLDDIFLKLEAVIDIISL